MGLRLLKVIVEPVFVEDDGEFLTEQPSQPVVVPASQWKDFVSQTFDDEVKRLQEEWQ